MPDEFISLFTTVYDRSVTVYERLQSIREGNRVKKTAENTMYIADFMSMPDYRTKLEKIFVDMKGILPSPEKLSLPYKHKERKDILTYRLCNLGSIYPLLDPSKVVYKIIHGNYDDHKMLQYPLSIEFLVVPYRNDSLAGNIHRASRFIGSVNYSLPPKSNEFEGDYSWFDEKFKFTRHTTSMTDILETFGFRFSEESGPKVKIPSIIFVNIICHKIDYHGHDKSRIVTGPFSDTIIKAAKKIAESVKTFQGEHFHFYDDMDHDDAPMGREEKMTAKKLTEIFLDRIMSGNSLDATEIKASIEKGDL